jgi:hypothetical protein
MVSNQTDAAAYDLEEVDEGPPAECGMGREEIMLSNGAGVSSALILRCRRAPRRFG